MKTIQIPSDITLVFPKGVPAPDKPITFAEFITDSVLTHQSFGEGSKAVIAAAKIATSLEKSIGERDASEKGVILWPWSLEDAHFEALKKAVETMQYQPMIARQLVPFLSAVLDAKDGLGSATRR